LLQRAGGLYTDAEGSASHDDALEGEIETSDHIFGGFAFESPTDAAVCVRVHSVAGRYDFRIPRRTASPETSRGNLHISSGRPALPVA
jgi:hypothetical protein